jgi:hypothetical protein
MSKSFTWAEINKRYPTVTARIPIETFKRLEKRCAQLREPRSLVIKGMIEASLTAAHLADAMDAEKRKNSKAKAAKGKQ